MEREPLIGVEMVMLVEAGLGNIDNLPMVVRFSTDKCLHIVSTSA